MSLTAQPIQIAEEVSARIRSQLDWPEQFFKRVQISPMRLPSGARSAPGGWLDDEGKYVFVTRIAVGLGFVDFQWRVFREEGRWRLHYADDRPPIPVTTDVDMGLDGVVEHVVAVLKRTIARQVWR